jgi:L-seryl-tRNA(Ser) seleniumtransferase
VDPRDLPSVDALAGALAGDSDLPRGLIVSVARDAIDEARESIQTGVEADPTARAGERLRSLQSWRLRRVVNATGVLLHTNLGRSPTAGGYPSGPTNLEFDLETGSRGARAAYLHALIASTTGAEAALVVNNNAGALFLALAAVVGRDGRVAVSRGELIEIGGSFRLPDLMTASGVHLIEVGTTNRTRAADFSDAPGGVEAVLKVHPSNYRLNGFTEEVSYAEMASVAAALGAPFIADIGSGLLDERVPWIPGDAPPWLAGEPGVRQTLEQGADVVLFSGDKLLGGPQAGIAVGRREVVEGMARHPVARALRVNTPTIAELTTTFEAYASGTALSLPFWTMATASSEELRGRYETLLSASGAHAMIADGASLPGAGSVPGHTIPTPVLRLTGTADRTWRGLADHRPPVVAARRDGSTVVNLRSVDPDDDPIVAAALAAI